MDIIDQIKYAWNKDIFFVIIKHNMGWLNVTITFHVNLTVHIRRELQYFVRGIVVVLPLCVEAYGF